MSNTARARWPALTSDPEVFTKMLHEMGVHENVVCRDVYGLEPELLAMIDGEPIAVLLCYPHTADDELKEEREKRAGAPPPLSDGLHFFWQDAELGNACGTVACIHAALNNPLTLNHSGQLMHLLQEVGSLNSKQRGGALAACDKLREIHTKYSHEGPASTGDGTDKVAHHFIAFVENNGRVYELDGFRAAPIAHGSVAENGGFLAAASKAVAAKMAKNPDGQYQMMALTKI
ncbi:Ubiquitin carboxyl-terminal hydrolase [Diplonema papillatum]|nr:Ubiquitin carboxyl-terminal hydrolase [Diplonema papillatum]|eukprot:gene15554-23745_t